MGARSPRTRKIPKKEKDHMCWLFHKWSKWEQYLQEGVSYGFVFKPVPNGMPYNEWRQRRHCERCGKRQDEKV
jgi:hypothetical protein